MTDNLEAQVTALRSDADWLDSYGPIDKQIAARVREAAATLERVLLAEHQSARAMRRWKSRAQAAEAQVEALRKAGERVSAQAIRRTPDEYGVPETTLDAFRAALSAPAEERSSSRDHAPTLRAALEEIAEECRNPGYPNDIVATRMIERIEETAAIALASSAPESDCAPPLRAALGDFLDDSLGLWSAAPPPGQDQWTDEVMARVRALQAAASSKLESSSQPSAWPFAFYDSHKAADRLETLAKLFEQTVEDKLTGRVSIAAPERAAADIREMLAEIERLTPKPSAHEHLTSAVYRAGPVTAEMYDEAIEDLQNAKRALVEGDSMGCRVCEDGGHSSIHCHHNPLALARKWVAATRIWQCYHCGYIATNDEEGREHFGRSEEDAPACQRGPDGEARSESSVEAPRLDREAIIEIVMRETTDDIIADGWDRLGKPNILVQGCKFVRGHGRGYEDPEEAARKFAGFIADALIAAGLAEARSELRAAMDLEDDRP